MKRNIRIRIRRLLAAALVAGTATAGSWSALAHADAGDSVDTTRVDVPEGNKMFFAAHAKGVQIYSCKATETGFAWTLLAPRANLYDDKDKLVATHFGGPTWQYQDGSTVVGKRVDGITVDPNSIQWLLLSGQSWTVGPDGDRFTHTTFIQRLSTVGGLPSATTTCDDTTVGTTQEVPYEADYTFWKKSNA